LTGKVYLVGAGPGDLGLLTVRGAELLRRADVVVYDRLANPRLLDIYLRRDATRIYVGKASSQHTLAQDQINELLVREAKAGKTVIRLHGGDPFVFGRGGEEAIELAAASIPFEVVPGVTSAVAAPAYAGIPVTHRGHNSSFAVITGHEDPNKSTSSIPWDKLANGPGVLVFLMGLANLRLIVEEMVKHGRPPSTPVAIIRWATWPQQQTLVGSLGDIVERVKAADFHPPAVIVVGSVVRLRDELRWWDNRPLSGKRVLVTRSREQASVLSEQLREQGAEPIEAPVLEIVPPESFEALDFAIGRLESYDWVVFTSANGVRIFLDRMMALGRDARSFGSARLAAIGPATARELSERFLRVDLVPDEFVAESVAAGMIGLGMEGRRVLLPRADLAREILPEMLETAGAAVDSVVCYRTVLAREDLSRIASMLTKGDIDVVTLASSSTARNLVAGLGDDALQLLSNTLIACIGPITAATARELGLHVGVVAPEHTIPGLVEAIVRVMSDE
jgi:uroporphyrinogen III methyltransferase / synthase